MFQVPVQPDAGDLAAQRKYRRLNQATTAQIIRDNAPGVQCGCNLGCRQSTECPGDQAQAEIAVRVDRIGWATGDGGMAVGA